SPVVQRWLGRPPAEMIGKTDFDLWPIEQAQRIRVNDTRVLSSDEALEVFETVPAADGTPLYWHVFKFPFWDATDRRLLGGVGVNVTARKFAEEKQQEYATRLQALSRRLLEVQEAERRHLARELHDEIGQTLTGLQFLLEPGPAASAAELRVRLEQARRMVDG